MNAPTDDYFSTPPDPSLSGDAVPLPEDTTPQEPEPQDQPENTPDNIGGLYFHDPNAIDDPNQVGKYLTKVSFFGGKSDYESKQDSGRYAFGGGSYDPKSGMESKVPALALPSPWFDKGIIKPGQVINVYNPNNPEKTLPVVATDKGPGMSTGRGADLYLPDDLKQHLGVSTDQNIGLDLTSVLRGSAQQVSQPPEPGTSYDEQLGNQIRQQISQQPDSSMIAGDMTADSIQQAMKSGPVSKNSDGSVNYGNGISVNPTTGVVQVESGGVIRQWGPGDIKPHISTVHAATPPAELIKEAREANLPLFNDDGTQKNGLQLQQQLDGYYKDSGLASPKVRQEAENIVKMQMSSRNPWSKQYLAIAPNYDQIQAIANAPHRTGADDIALMQAIANIEAPGRSSTTHDMQQWMQARGIAGQLGITKQRYGAAFDYLTGKMSQEDWEKGGQVLPAELVQQMKAVADRSMESRYKQYMTGIQPVINRLQKLGVNPEDYIPDAVNPVTGISPFAKDGDTPQRHQAAARSTPSTLTPDAVVKWAQSKLNDPNATQDEKDTAQKALSSVNNSGQ